MTLSSQTMLEEAFRKAKEIFTDEAGLDASRRGLWETETSMLDVHRELLRAQDVYVSNAQCKARKWLVALSERITYYGQIFDVLVQQHPEYVSLAWGTFKFVFMAVLNHQEIIKKLAKGLCQIADILPRANLTLILYPTAMMQDVLARLYANIIQFISQAVHWYRQGKLKHSVFSIIRPWKVSFQESLESIKDDSIRLDKLSDMAAKAELRDTHVEVVEIRKNWAETKFELGMMRQENQRLADYITTGMSRIDSAIMSMHKELHFDLRGQMDMLCSVQLNQILSISFLEKLPTCGESLEYCQSIRRRSRHRMTLPLPDVSRLADWASKPTNSLLVLQGTSSAVSKAFMIDLIDLVRDAKMPVIWALRYANYWDSPTTSIDILRMLVLQALQMNPQAMAQGSHPITMAGIREAATATDWLEILARALQGVPRIFIALDPGLLTHATANDTHQGTELVEAFRSRLVTSVKIFASASNLDRAYVADRHTDRQCISLEMDGSHKQSGKQWRRKRNRKGPRPMREH
ncbi:MAG: hypothetical protein ASARMPREDX12_007126 [Alectoria sarmentosa]|nr:MAG: hypothetical protein ASARMPREDX12_007126 [Alectoria sarmentosa]